MIDPVQPMQVAPYDDPVSWMRLKDAGTTTYIHSFNQAPAVRGTGKALQGCLRFTPPNSPAKTMKAVLMALLALLAATCFTSCVAGHVDRVEDRYDRREDRYDRRHWSGPGDRREDYWDKRENVNDKLRGRRGLYY